MNISRLLILSVLLIALVIVLWWNRPLSSDQLYNQHFEPYIIQTTPRGLMDVSEAYMLATIHYRDKAFDQAIAHLNIALKENPQDYRVRLMLGISHMALKNFKAAELIFKALAEDRDHLFQNQARWYLGLLYLTDSNAENDQLAHSYFSQIEDEVLLEKVWGLD